MPKTITLNVDGTIYETTKELLCCVPGSYFYALFKTFNPNNCTVATKAGIFIDANGKLFKYVLAYLRCPRLDAEVMKQVEAEFFGLKRMADALKE